MRKVLRRVREDQGPDAVILSNRRTEDGIEVIAAIDYDESILLQTLGAQPSSAAYSRIAEPADEPVAAVDQTELKVGVESVQEGEPQPVAQPVAQAAAQPVAKPAAQPEESAETAPATEPEPKSEIGAVEVVAADLRRVEPENELPAAEPAHVMSIDSLRAPRFDAPERAESDDDSLNVMRTEISSIRGLMESQLSALVWKDEAIRSPLRAQVLRNLARIGISPDVAALVVSRLDAMPETKQVWRAPLAQLVEMLPVKQDALLDKGGVVAMIGPTGVGKTTSIAKIAARYAMIHGTKDVALVCADAYRIGAKEHLAAFGRIIGAQVHSVGESGDLAGLLESLRSKQLVLIDTDGMSQRDANLSGRLAEYAKYSNTVDFYLTLSATSQEAGLDETIRRFGELPLAGAVISKIDEAGQLGCVMNTLIRHDLPAVWFSDGQRIPDDIHEAAKKRLWLVNQAIECMEASDPRVDEQMMADRYAQASVAHA